MKLRRTMSAVLAATMILSGAAFAAEPGTETVPQEPAVAQPEQMLALLENFATVKEASDGQLLVTMEEKEGLPSEVALNLGEETVIIDNQTGAAAAASSIKAGDRIYVYFSPAMTRSLPPQSFCEAIVVNIAENTTPAHYLTVDAMEEAEDSVRFLDSTGSIYVTIPNDAPISSLKTKDIVKNTDLTKGTKVFAWYDIVALSYPGQTTATRAVIAAKAEPSEETEARAEAENETQQDSAAPAATEIKSLVLEGDMVLDVPVISVNGIRTVPLRQTAETLGFTVKWNQADQSAELDNGKRASVVRIGLDSYYYTASKTGSSVIGMSKPEPFGVAPYISDGSTYVPVKLFELLGFTVSENGDTLHID